MAQSIGKGRVWEKWREGATLSWLLPYFIAGFRSCKRTKNVCSWLKHPPPLPLFSFHNKLNETCPSLFYAFDFSPALLPLPSPHQFEFSWNFCRLLGLEKDCILMTLYGIAFFDWLTVILCALCTDKKGNKIFLMYKTIQMGSVAKSYIRKGLQIYEEMRKYLVIYEEAVSHKWLCNCSRMNFLIYEENFIFFFISMVNKLTHFCWVGWPAGLGQVYLQQYSRGRLWA